MSDVPATQPCMTMLAGTSSLFRHYEECVLALGTFDERGPGSNRLGSSGAYRRLLPQEITSNAFPIPKHVEGKNDSVTQE